MGDLSTLVWMWGVLTGLLITWYAHTEQLIPELSTNPVQYLAASGAVFLGTVVGTVTSLRLYDLTKLRVLRLLRPHRITITPSGGRSAAVTITHSGEPAAWEARMRIVRTLDRSANPNPLQDQCFLYRDGKTHRSLELRKGESAHIVLATIKYNQWSGHRWLSVEHARGGTWAPDAGVVVELEIKSEPPPTGGLIKRCFSIRRIVDQNLRRRMAGSGRDEIEIEEMP